MAKFRKKPVVVEAVQWTGSNADEIKELCVGMVAMQTRPGLFAVNTLNGTVHAEVGEWIIRGVAGEVYPCRPDIFAATYEPISEEDPTEENPSANVMLLELLEPIDPKKVQKLRDQIAGTRLRTRGVN